MQAYRKDTFLNMPIDQLGRWMDMQVWTKCAGDLQDLTGAKCVGAGLDLAPVHDFSSLVLLFDVEGIYYAKPFFWCNEADLLERSRIGRVAGVGAT